MHSLAGLSRGLGWLAAALAAFALLIPAASFGAGEIPELGHQPLADLDSRTGSVDPTAAQVAAAEALGAEVRWNRFGTPQSLIKYGDSLATGLSGANAETVARNWLERNGTLFRLDSTEGLRVLSSARLEGSDGYVVTFEQRFGNLTAAEDGHVTVGVVGSAQDGWNVAYASSSLTAQGLAGRIDLTPQEAWLRAAADIGRGVSLLAIGNAKADRGWTVFPVRGLTRLQRARPAALPTPENGVRPVYETLYVESAGGHTEAYTHYIDAQNGAVLMRKNLVMQSHQAAEVFTGAVPAQDAACAPDNGPWTVADGESVETIAVSVEAALTTNDSVIHLVRNGTIVASQDTLFSPEALAYDPADDGQGTYHVRVCDFGDGHAWDDPRTYTGQIVFSPVGGGTLFPYPPKWEVFPAYPLLGGDAFPWNNPSTDTRETWCWETSVGYPPTPLPECERGVSNLASRVPWDYSPRTNAPTFTTVGNNAVSAEAWMSPLTPGPTGYRPVSLSREYVYPWTNAWSDNPPANPEGCSPTNFVPGAGNDISAAVTNLFVMHNRMHDWAYHLGFDERRWNAQESNFGNGGAERDPLLGDAQAGAVSGGYPSYLGRDNANMIPLPDGVAPITNMYLWQPLAGAFYAPCVDGDYDMAVIGHEFAHLVEVRMTGKGGSRGGHHAGAMGESSADLNAVEYLNEYNFVPVSGENRFAVGAYATGNKRRAIRNYGMNFPQTGAFPTPGVTPQIDPLNFSDMGYDLTGPQVHADGEIWSATGYDIRTALVDKYDAQYPESDATLQRECADGERPADSCPGNRRWIQLMYDAFQLMPVAPSMLDARDAYLAADQMRFGGANQAELWGVFAKRGFGAGAFSTNSAADTDTDPKPDFGSPLHANSTVTFRAVAADDGNAPVTTARVYVGHYEARVSPVADTNPATNAAPPGANNLDDTAQFRPGTYELFVHAPGFGHQRVRRTFSSGSTVTVTFSLRANWASQTRGGTVGGDGTRQTQLIDDTERTNWESTGTPVGGRQVTVDLSGGVKPVRRVQVSAMLQPGQNRFTALRQFEIRTCNADDPATANCTLPSSFTTIYTSPANAFPGVTPRPAGPDLILREFDVPDTRATHVQIRVLTNQCTGNPDFQGEQDNDPANSTDCRVGSPGVLAPRGNEVRIAELQVYSR